MVHFHENRWVAIVHECVAGVTFAQTPFHVCRSTCSILLLLFYFLRAPAFAQRDTIPFNTDWRFTVDREARGFNEEWYAHELPGSTPVTLPHTWNTNEATQDHYGWGWYRKEFDVPPEWAEKNVVLRFGAINHSAIIYVNGKSVAENNGDGFSAFAVVLNMALRPGKNTITVAVNNDYGRNKVPFGSSFDWPNDGGIIRKVMLIMSDRPAVERIHASPTLKLADSSGTVGFALDFWQDEQAPVELDLRITEENQPTRNTILHTTIQPVWREGKATVEVALPRVKPWHFDDPNLYRIDVRVMQSGKSVDAVSTCIGFRTLDFADGLLRLNGEPIKWMGVEWTAGSNPDFGFAEPDSVIAAHVDLMKDVNTIFTREHFQQDELFYDLCDRKGILVQQEVPLWGPETPANDTMQRIALRQLQRMVDNYRNHPSIFAWGVGNELRARDADMRAMIERLIAEARRLDPSRFATYVSNSLTTSFRDRPGFVPDAAAAGDCIMMNEYGGSWWPIPAGAIGSNLDSVHASYPDKPFFISEFGLCEPNFDGGDPRRIEDMIYHTAVYESKPYVAGAIYFDLTDYRTHYPGTKETPKYRHRIHGVYDMYGKPKPSMAVLRELSSPVEIQQARTNANGTVEVTLFGSLGLPQHIVRGYKLFVSASEDHRAGKMIDLPVIAPGQCVAVQVEGIGSTAFWVTVERPTGYVVTRERFE